MPGQILNASTTLPSLVHLPFGIGHLVTYYTGSSVRGKLWICGQLYGTRLARLDVPTTLEVAFLTPSSWKTDNIPSIPNCKPF